MDVDGFEAAVTRAVIAGVFVFIVVLFGLWIVSNQWRTVENCELLFITNLAVSSLCSAAVGYYVLRRELRKQ